MIRLSDKIKISVVIPAYNEEKWLPGVLAALHNGIRKPDQIIVVDNASTDNTATLARSWGADVVFCEEPGVALARQAGLEAAWGDWIATTDADSRPSQHWLSALERAILSPTKPQALYGPLAFFDVNPFQKWTSEQLYRIFLRTTTLCRRPMLAGANSAFSHEHAIRVGGYPNLHVGEDIALGKALTREGRSNYVRDALVWTSARRMKEIGWFQFLTLHLRNLSGQQIEYFHRT